MKTSIDSSLNERKHKFIVLALISIALDLLTSFIEIPFLGWLPFSLTAEEGMELIISTVISRDQLKLTWFDRVLGLIPLPGITAITVHLARQSLNKVFRSKR